MISGSRAEGFRRHLEGWQLGLWVVLVCGLSALLVVPRDVPPDSVPPPRVDRLQQREAAASDAERAERGRGGLPVTIRAVGEAFRGYGRAALSQRELLPRLVPRLRRLTTEALERHGPEPLLELRALQTERFVSAFEGRPASPALEVVELAGGLLHAGLARGWFAAPPDGADDGELGTLFRIYWADALGLGARHPFAPSLNEWRAYYRFMLGRPVPEDPPDREGDLQRKLEYVAALAQHDQDYPAPLARGILLYQRGAPAQAAAELQAHLERHPDGPWTLRARNYLAACGALLLE